MTSMEGSSTAVIEHGGETSADRIFHGVRKMRGLPIGLSRNYRLKVLSYAVWFCTVTACFISMTEFARQKTMSVTERFALTDIVTWLVSITSLFISPNWRLTYLMKNEDFELIIRKQGRTLSGIA